MEPTRRPSSDILPPRRPTAIAGNQRTVFNDFGPRPTRPVQPASPVPHPPPVATPAQRPTPTLHSNTHDAAPSEKLETPDSPASGKAPREPHETAHSGWVGLVVFLVLAAIVLFSPITGKVFRSFPGSSASDSTGEQSIGCIDTLGPIKTSTIYTTKRGFPIVYNYETTSTISANCDGAAKTATGGHTSQFNPLGALLDILAGAIVAIVFAKIWRALFSPKPAKR